MRARHAGGPARGRDAGGGQVRVLRGGLHGGEARVLSGLVQGTGCGTARPGPGGVPDTPTGGGRGQRELRRGEVRSGRVSEEGDAKLRPAARGPLEVSGCV